MASFRFPLAMDTLAIRLAVPLAGSALDFNQLVSAPCRAQSGRRRGINPAVLPHHRTYGSVSGGSVDRHFMFRSRTDCRHLVYLAGFRPLPSTEARLRGFCQISSRHLNSQLSIGSALHRMTPVTMASADFSGGIVQPLRAG